MTPVERAKLIAFIMQIIEKSARSAAIQVDFPASEVISIFADELSKTAKALIEVCND